MNTKLLLIAASTLAIAACGGSDADVEVAETDANAAETLLSEEQPVLEGDSPFVDGEDVADSTLDEESYDTGLDGPDLTDDGFGTEAVADLDDDAEHGIGALVAESERIASDAGARAAELAEDGERMAADAGTAARDVAATVTDGIAAKQFTANNTDAYINDAGELITGSEAALLAGTYEVALPGQTGTKTLYITGEGDKAVGTFDGEPIEVMVTGRNFSFDAPVEMDGTADLMTFAGTFENGVIDNGVLESQGDGTTMTFTAVRTGADTDMDAREMLDDAGAAASGAMNDARRGADSLLDETGDAIKGAYDGTTDAVGDAYDRATDGSDDTNLFGTDDAEMGDDMRDEDAMLDDESTVGIEDGVPSGIIRSGTTDLGQEPLDARGDTSTAADTGFGVGEDPIEDGDVDTDDPNFDM